MIENRILVVEDEDKIRKQLVRATRRLVREVDDAADGLVACELFRRYRHPLVLLDLRLPKRDGMDVLREIKEVNPATKTVILTAHGSEEDAINALNSGAFRYLKKPPDLSTIEQAIDAGYARYRQELELSAESSRQVGDSFDQEIDDLYRRIAELAPRVSEADDFRREYEDAIHQLRARQRVEADRARRLLRASVPLDPERAREAMRAAREELGHDASGSDNSAG